MSEKEYFLEYDKNVQQRLMEFCCYFFLTVDKCFQYSLDILEGNPNCEIKRSLLGSVLAISSTVIPVVGKAVSLCVKELDKFVLNKLDKRKAAMFANMIYNFMDNKELFKIMFVEAAATVFQSYEILFMQLTCKGGPTKAMQKLAEDATHRFISHLKFVDEVLTPDIVIKGILFGYSSGVFKSGRTLTKGNRKIKSSKIYSKVGVVLKKDDKRMFYKNLNSKTKKYGYRLAFIWEDLSEWELEEVPSEFKSELEEDNIAEKIPAILQYINRKVIRETSHQTIVQLFEERHLNLENDIESKQQKVMETIEKQGEMINKKIDDTTGDYQGSSIC